MSLGEKIKSKLIFVFHNNPKDMRGSTTIQERLFSISNIIFSLFFVLYLNLNVKGVALGTLFSSTLTSFIFLIY